MTKGTLSLVESRYCLCVRADAGRVSSRTRKWWQAFGEEGWAGACFVSTRQRAATAGASGVLRRQGSLASACDEVGLGGVATPPSGVRGRALL